MLQSWGAYYSILMNFNFTLDWESELRSSPTYYTRVRIIVTIIIIFVRY